LTSEETFNQWFHDVPEWNKVIDITLVAVWDESLHAYTFNAPDFFPIDGLGWSEGVEEFHNYGFCLTLYNQFTYQKGQKFDFTGDDDVWVFIDRKLELDLGGPHPPQSASINLDDIGLTVGNTYDFAFFFCERHVWGSSLKFTTSIKLDPCGLTDSDGDSVGDLCDACPFGNPELEVKASSVSGLTASIDIKLGADVKSDNGLNMNIDFGDGSTDTQYTSIDSRITHTYERAGTYTVKITSDAMTGCTASSAEAELTFTTDGTRVAPKCSSIPSMGIYKR
jgi:fibro-slime domain-containing protein